MTDETKDRILLHAPTAGALKRARSNAGNLLAAEPRPVVRIVVNAEAVAAVLDDPNAGTDALTLVCRNTLNRLGRSAEAPLTVLEEGAVLSLARMQREGWAYIRA